jgi:AcrR family transcriptional regulator
VLSERGRPEQRQAFLSGAVEHVLRHGASGLSLRPLAAALGTSDRMLLYYFGSREHLLETVLDSVGDGLVAALSEAVPVGRSRPEVLLRAVWSIARDPGVEPVLRLYVETVGQAAAQVAPFPAVARRVAGRWLTWAQDRVDVPVAEQQDAAAALLASVDGLLVLHFAVGSGVADRAARRLLHWHAVQGAPQASPTES